MVVLSAGSLVALIWSVVWTLMEQPRPRLVLSSDLDLTSELVEVPTLVVWSWALARALVRVPAQERVRVQVQPAQERVRVQVQPAHERVRMQAQVRRLLALVMWGLS